MKVIAINALERAKDADPVKIAPGDIVELTGKELKIALAANAVREPTEDEVLLHDARKAKAEKQAALEDADEDNESGKSNDSKKSDKTDGKKASTPKPSKKAAEKTSDAAPAGATETQNPPVSDPNGGGNSDDIVLD